MPAYELPPIGHALSGGVAAALANIVIYPLDLATTRVQSQSSSTSSTSSSSSHTLSSSASSNDTALHHNHGDQQQLQPIEFIRPSLPQSSSTSTKEVSSDVSVDESGRKKITKTILTTTTTTTTTTKTATSLQAQSQSNSTLKPPTKQHYTSVLDAIRKTFKHEGFLALYAGLGSDTIATLASNFVYFYVYMALRQRKERRRKSGQLSTVQELFLGAEAGIISRFFTAPIHVVTTRQQVMGSHPQEKETNHQQQQRCGGSASALSIIRGIYEQDGITGFWAGYAPTVILSINPSITYFLFETIKRLIIERQTKAVTARAGSAGASKSVLAAAATLTSLQVFFISACSKAIASFLTYPLILTKTKLQTKEVEEDSSEGKDQADSIATDGASKKKQFEGISDVIRTVIRDSGIKGLYAGCQGQVVKGFFSFGLMYMIKDRVVAWMLTVFLAMHSMRNRVTSK
ncbi:hypothetical protein BGZ94_008107 [Podila epigama]|nr:hypothetical protein BGZ94_008107 [Podila epigama]